ncbi:hypothetical protein [Gorillibacterium massiliense]|uniref:hypothetical protein n=1 Tax=Gorillibacterium massiliense TaxID=1280390 RepID=UPI0004B44AFC|nr:hypothetical protein [Gorillibacterium massiliense]
MARRSLRPSDLEVLEEFAEPAEDDGNLWDAMKDVLCKLNSVSDKDVMERDAGSMKTDQEELLMDEETKTNTGG